MNPELGPEAVAELLEDFPFSEDSSVAGLLVPSAGEALFTRSFKQEQGSSVQLFTHTQTVCPHAVALQLPTSKPHQRTQIQSMFNNTCTYFAHNA